MITSDDVEFVTVEVTVEFVVEQDVDMVLVEALEDDELVAVVLVVLVVEVDEVLAVVELRLVVTGELAVVDGSVVEVDDVVTGVDEEVVVAGRLEEELEEPELGGVRTTYAPMLATAITTIIMTARTTGAMPSLFRNTMGIQGGNSI